MYDLIIVESPAKAKTISNFLGKGYEVIASKGHIRDLPSYKTGVKISDKDVLPEYEIKNDHRSIAKDIIGLSKKAREVYIATDEDREGEAIGWHITHILGKPYDQYPRIVFHEITKSAITKALNNPRKIDIDKVEAQQARRILDRVVGFNLSSLLQSKIQKGLSAGRVQSCVLNLILEKEEEIKKFISKKYWTYDYYGYFSSSEGETNLGLHLTHYNPNGDVSLSDTVEDKTTSNVTIFQNEKEAEKIKSELETRAKDFQLISLERLPVKKLKPKPPFMTSTLQQYMSTKYGYGPTKTMQLAQKLYEGVDTHTGKQGIITYMRTDSLNIASEAQATALDYISRSYGKNYCPDKPNNYVSGSKGAQEAHEAIRPTNIEFTPEIAKKYLESDELKLYTAVYERFLASQSVPLEYVTSVLRVGDDKFIFTKTGKETTFDGYSKVAPSLASEDKPLPKLNVQVGDKIKYDKIEMLSKETQPPPRYNEASLVKVMEKEGIGRPSTYAATVSLLLKREYVKLENKSLVPTENAYKVIDGLRKYFSYLLDKKYTAKLEEELDEISNKTKEWKRLLIDFYGSFKGILDQAKVEMPTQKIAIPTGENCPKCGGPMIIRNGKYGEFESCSAYPKCKYIKQKEREQQPIVYSDYLCPSCKEPLQIKNGRYGEYYACDKDTCKIISKHRPINEKCTTCKSYKVSKVYNGKEIIQCPKCDSKPFKRRSRRKR